MPPSICIAAIITATTTPRIIAVNNIRSPSLIFFGRFLLNNSATIIPEKSNIPIIKKTKIHSLNCWLRIPSMLRSSLGEISGFICEIWNWIVLIAEMRIVSSYCKYELLKQKCRAFYSARHFIYLLITPGQPDLSYTNFICIYLVITSFHYGR